MTSEYFEIRVLNAPWVLYELHVQHLGEMKNPYNKGVQEEGPLPPGSLLQATIRWRIQSSKQQQSPPHSSEGREQALLRLRILHCLCSGERVMKYPAGLHFFLII